DAVDVRIAMRLVPLASFGSSPPTYISTGSVRNDPPPAIVLTTPAINPAVTSAGYTTQTLSYHIPRSQGGAASAALPPPADHLKYRPHSTPRRSTSSAGTFDRSDQIASPSAAWAGDASFRSALTSASAAFISARFASLASFRFPTISS